MKTRWSPTQSTNLSRLQRRETDHSPLCQTLCCKQPKPAHYQPLARSVVFYFCARGVCGRLAPPWRGFEVNFRAGRRSAPDKIRGFWALPRPAVGAVVRPLRVEGSPPMEAFFIATALVALAEMGDKTQLLARVLAARFRKPWPIVLGILVATVVTHGLAGAVGGWLASFAGTPL